MNLLTIFYIGIPALAVLAGLLSKLKKQTLTRIFNLLMLAAVIAGAIFIFTTHLGWIHILSFVALTILGNMAGVFVVSRKS